MLVESGEGEKLSVFRLSRELGCLGSTKYVRKLHDIIQIFSALRFLIFIISLIDLTHLCITQCQVSVRHLA